MRSSVPFAVFSGLLAAVYLWIAHTSGSEKTRSGDLLAGALLYGPLVVAGVSSLRCKTDEQVASLPWVLLAVLVLSTIFGAILGYNMAGALVGLVNLVICWVLVVGVIKAVSTKKNDV
jgi:uncharacterized membrane protein HdeD (DUF308 family)